MLKSLFGLKSSKERQKGQKHFSVSANVPETEPTSDGIKLPKLAAAGSGSTADTEQPEKVSSEVEPRQALPGIPSASSGRLAGQPAAKGANNKLSTSSDRRPTGTGPDQDISGSVFFLRGKLKEMTDLIGGGDALRQRRAGRSGELLKLLAALLRGEDEDTEKVRRGRSLNDTSRHRPDLAADPDAACARFADPRLAALRRFPEAAAPRLALAWETAAADYMLAATVPELLRHLEGDAGGATREAAVLRGLVAAMSDTLRPVAAAMGAVAPREPDLVWVNMRGVADRAAAAALAAGSAADPEAAQRQEAVAAWLREREAAILAIMRDNVERLGPAGEPLWGRADDTGHRLRVPPHPHVATAGVEPGWGSRNRCGARAGGWVVVVVGSWLRRVWCAAAA
jgi:hypothetical protein